MHSNLLTSHLESASEWQEGDNVGKHKSSQDRTSVTQNKRYLK